MSLTESQILEIDRRHIWHPYSSIFPPVDNYVVRRATGSELELFDGRRLIDGMASWWSVIHGYNHPVLNNAVQAQLQDFAHVMFGGLTHESGARLAQLLVRLTPAALTRVFFADSGSVAVEVAMKMALQYWLAKARPAKTKFVSLRNGYHGDTMGAMSVCDPVTGMHHLFTHVLASNFFIESPRCGFHEPCARVHTEQLQQLLEHHHQEIAALILEPIVQGAGGMRFYAPDYLAQARRLCEAYDVLLIADEIATGFGRTGELFACDHAQVTPDILCVGKALTGGYMTMAATLCTEEVATAICAGPAGVFMHGPTFMGNPMACSVAIASIELLLAGDWRETIKRIEMQLAEELRVCQSLPEVKEVRCLGAIGVVELHQPIDMKRAVPAFVEQGIWVRPFGRLVYIMPPYTIEPEQLSRLTNGIFEVIKNAATA